MSIESMNAKAGPYECDGVQSSFDFSFKPLNSSYVTVYVNDDVVSSGYTVAVNGTGTGGTVTFTTPPTSGAKLAIIRNVPPTQLVDLQNNTAFLPEVIESALDKSVALVQQQMEVMTRAFVVPPTAEDPEAAIRDIIAEIAGSGGSGGGTVDYANRAGSATNAGHATTADTATTATNAGSATNAGYATRAGSAAASGGTADYAAVAGVAAASGGSADYAASAGYTGPFAVKSNGLNPYSGVDVIVNGGRVVAGGTIYEVDGQEAGSVFIPEGGCVYLHGSSGATPTFNYVNSVPDAIPTGEFYTALSENLGGTMVQRQFSDVFYPGWDAAAAFDYTGPFAAHKTAAITSGAKVLVSSGTVVVGNSRYSVGSSSINVSNGRTLWLVGTSNGATPTFAYSAATTTPSVGSSQFCLKIADVTGGEVRQIQFGEVATVQWNLPSGGGTMIFPNFYALESGMVYISSGTSLYSSSSLERGSTYTMASAGYVRVSVKNFQGGGCVRFHTGGASMGLFDARSGGPGCTWPAIPLSSGATFCVTSEPDCDSLIKCDVTVYK